MRRGAWWWIEASGLMIAHMWHLRGEDTMRIFRRIVSAAVMLIPLMGVAGAADIRVLSVGAVQHAVRELATQFGKETGHHGVLTIGSPVVVMQKIKDGEVADAVIVAEPAMDQLDKEGVVNPESRVPLAKPAWGWRCARVRRCRTSRRRRHSSRHCSPRS